MAQLRGAGPEAVVTNLGILEPDQNGELVLTALHPGIQLEQASENTGWGCSNPLKVYSPSFSITYCLPARLATRSSSQIYPRGAFIIRRAA